jgi:hypothetical protein
MEKKHWLTILSENIVSLIAMSILAFTFTIFLLILLREVKTTESTTITILASITNIAMLVIGYYFGSSKGSKDKQDKLMEINKIEETKTQP